MNCTAQNPQTALRISAGKLQKPADNVFLSLRRCRISNEYPADDNRLDCGFYSGQV